MAAQSLVRKSYRSPIETYETNIMGTAYLLEAARNCNSVKVIVNVTTDKCYRNKEDVSAGYKETEPLGGYDPYSSSKACSELITSAYRDSFFSASNHSQRHVFLASVRAGNVIGGGDWATDRLIPDCLAALSSNEKNLIRNPYSIRPWQHVLEPLDGYMTLIQMLYKYGSQYEEEWNFGPDDNEMKPVKWIVDTLCGKWGHGSYDHINNSRGFYEVEVLKLDSSKAKKSLKWQPKWSLDTAIEKVVYWTKQYQKGENILDVCLEQIKEYERDPIVY